MTENEVFEYAMLAWVALMIGTLLTVAWHLSNPFAQGGVTEGRDGEAGSVSEANSTRSDEVGCAPTSPDPTPSKLGG